MQYEQEDKFALSQADYMSNAIIPGLEEAEAERHVQSTRSTVAPPVPQSLQKELQIAKREKNFTRVSQLKREIRQLSAQQTTLEGTKRVLETSILEEDGKALQMLKKMGYRHGTGLGKREQGVTEPVSIDLSRVESKHQKFMGIGMQTHENEQASLLIEQNKQLRMQEGKLKEQFLERMRRRHAQMRKKRGRLFDDGLDASDEDDDENERSKPVRDINEEEIELSLNNDDIAEQPMAKRQKVQQQKDSEDDSSSYGDDFDDFK